MLTPQDLLDEALSLMSAEPEPRGMAHWIQLLSGDTWSLSAMAMSLKSVRERLMCQLLRKGVLCSEEETTLARLLETGAYHVLPVLYCTVLYCTVLRRTTYQTSTTA